MIVLTIAALAGDAIRAIRAEAGLTQADLSALTRIGKPLISKYEGVRIVPGVAALVRLANATGHRVCLVPRAVADADAERTAVIEAARAYATAADPRAFRAATLVMLDAVRALEVAERSDG